MKQFLKLFIKISFLNTLENMNFFYKSKNIKIK
jgi:hypothetical protein